MNFLFVFTAKTIAQKIAIFSNRCCNQTISVVEKHEQNLRQNHLISDSMNEIAESYYRLSTFSLKQWKSGKITNQIETEKLIIKSILRGMRYDSKNARLQFPRLFQIENINTTELTDLFNAEVTHSSF